MCIGRKSRDVATSGARRSAPEGAPPAEGQESTFERPVNFDEETFAKCIKVPVKPSPEEIAQHNVCHLPFRSWCTP